MFLINLIVMCNNPRIICYVSPEAHKRALWAFRVFAKPLLHILSYIIHHNFKPYVFYNLKQFHDYNYYCNHDVMSQYFFKVPCHKCLGCLSDKRNDWASRCLLEASHYDNNCFVTLTYNDDHLPPCLVRKDYQDFFKRLRQYCKRNGLPSPREFYRGEYGERFSRPHFHFIGFNLDFPDKRVLYYVYKGKRLKEFVPGSYPIYTSAILEKLWGKGFVTIAPVNLQNIKYVANYLDKGQSPIAYEAPPFHGWSNRPGLGRKWFDEHFSNSIDDLMELFSITSVSLPCRSIRYFRRLIKERCPIIYNYLVDYFKDIALSHDPPWITLGISEYDYLQRREDAMKSALQKFGRKANSFY